MQWTEFSFILGVSQACGIGVFATHDIPKGTLVFSGSHSPRKIKTKDVPKDFLKYCIFLNDEECLIPERFDRMEIGWYLNHSDSPNISRTLEKRMITIRDIKAGEEILCDYNELDEPEHLKEDYYKK